MNESTREHEEGNRPGEQAPDIESNNPLVPLEDGPHPPNTFVFEKRREEMETNVFALVNHMFRHRPPGEVKWLGVGVAEDEILEEVYENSASSLKSHAFKANKVFRALKYMYRLARKTVPGEGTYVSWVQSEWSNDVGIPEETD